MDRDENLIDVSEPVRLSEEGLAYLRRKIDALNTRKSGAGILVLAEPVEYTWAILADRITGKPQSGPTLLSPEELPHAPVVSVQGHARWFDVRVTLNAPRIEGHTFIARVEHLSEGNVLYAGPGVASVPACYRTAPPTCQHCLTTRRRSDTFVLKDEQSDAYVQIGRNCLADYCRSPEAAARLLDWASIVQQVDGTIRESVSLYANGSGGRWYWSFPLVVALAKHYTARFGWLSAAKARDQNVESSAHLILAQCSKTSGQSHWFCGFGEDPGVRSLAVADVDNPSSDVHAAVEWVKSHTGREDASDYLHNLSVLANAGSVHSGQFALAASAWAAYTRYVEEATRKEAERKREQATGSTRGNHVGTVGEREVFEGVRCVQIKAIGESDWGVRYLVKFLTGDGNELVWFTGEGTKFDPDEGQTYTIKATVKEHAEYRGFRNTVITRVSEYEEKPKAPRKPRAKKGVAGE